MTAAVYIRILLPRLMFNWLKAPVALPLRIESSRSIFGICYDSDTKIIELFDLLNGVTLDTE